MGNYKKFFKKVTKSKWTIEGHFEWTAFSIKHRYMTGFIYPIPAIMFFNHDTGRKYDRALYFGFLIFQVVISFEKEKEWKYE